MKPSNNSNKVPPIDDALVSYLDGIFPDKAPDFHEADREVWIKAGQVSVIRFLKKELMKQSSQKR